MKNHLFINLIFGYRYKIKEKRFFGIIFAVILTLCDLSMDQWVKANWKLFRPFPNPLLIREVCENKKEKLTRQGQAVTETGNFETNEKVY